MMNRIMFPTWFVAFALVWAGCSDDEQTKECGQTASITVDLTTEQVTAVHDYLGITFKSEPDSELTEALKEQACKWLGANAFGVEPTNVPSNKFVFEAEGDLSAPTGQITCQLDWKGLCEAPKRTGDPLPASTPNPNPKSETLVKNDCGSYDTAKPADSSKYDVVTWNLNKAHDQCEFSLPTTALSESLDYSDFVDTDADNTLYIGDHPVNVDCGAGVSVSACIKFTEGQPSTTVVMSLPNGELYTEQFVNCNKAQYPEDCMEALGSEAPKKDQVHFRMLDATSDPGHTILRFTAVGSNNVDQLTMETWLEPTDFDSNNMYSKAMDNGADAIGDNQCICFDDDADNLCDAEAVAGLPILSSNNKGEDYWAFYVLEGEGDTLTLTQNQPNQNAESTGSTLTMSCQATYSAYLSR